MIELALIRSLMQKDFYDEHKVVDVLTDYLVKMLERLRVH